jgi:hypothetical protein
MFYLSDASLFDGRSLLDNFRQRDETVMGCCTLRTATLYDRVPSTAPKTLPKAVLLLIGMLGLLFFQEAAAAPFKLLAGN